MQTAKRIQQLPPYIFARINQSIAKAKAEGVDIINFGIGDPDRPTPPHIIEELQKQAMNPDNHRYPSYVGMPEFRKAIADWYLRRFNVTLDPDNEVVTLIGSKEGIAHIAWCFIDPGDTALIPDPGYPVYSTGVLLAGGKDYTMPLLEANGFLPDLSAIPTTVAKQAKLMFLNYPNNPTGALANKEFFAEVVEFAKTYDIVVCHDAAYTEIAFDGEKPISFLETPGAKDVGIEFHSLSKTYNMTGWRVAWAVGNAEVIEALGRIKSNIDSGIFQAVQYAGIRALTGPQDCIQQMQELYARRRDLVVDGLRQLGWTIEKPKATIYVWAKVPSGYTSTEFATMLLEKAGIVVTPGIGYGEHGDKYFRISLCIEEERIIEAFERLKQANIRFS